MRSRSLRVVPLPDVPEYTDDIIFGNLGLPSGFDQERLLVNIRGMQRVRAAALMGAISIVSERGEASEYDYSVTSIGTDGSATLGAASKSRPKPVSTCEVWQPLGSNTEPSSWWICGMAGRPNTTITLNKAEIEERIRDKQHLYGQGLIDPHGYADNLHRAVRHGMLQAVTKVTIGGDKWFPTGLGVGSAGLFAVADPTLIPVVLLLEPQAVSVKFLRDMFAAHGKGPQAWAAWKQEWRSSLFLGWEFDRLAAGMSLAAATRYIRARK